MTEKIQKLEKADGQSMDIVESNIEQLKELFPEIFAEGKINFDRLHEVLGNYVVTDEDHYNFTWHGKRAAGRLAQTPSTGTLRPCPQESVDWDKTQNLFIEGDNLEVLKLLQKSYHRQIKMIYIDPPYNTGNDFVYEDDFKDGVKNYLAVTGQLDNEGKKKGTNSNSAGRYHTNWLNMMYPRLKLARNLLRDDGVIFISIDDNEVHNLKKICDEVFGEGNFVTQITRATGTPTGGGGGKATVNELDYVLVYSKSENLQMFGTPFTDEESSIYDKEDERGKYLIRSLRRTGGEDRREDRPTMYYPVMAPDGTKVYPIAPAGYESRWICGQDKFQEMSEAGLIEWKKDLDGKWTVYQKFYLEGRLKQPGNLWTDVEGNKKATRDIRDLFDGVKVFDFPKPVGFIQKILEISSTTNDLILDFFAGSGTTAHATMRLNTRDEGKRRFIVAQMPEAVDPTTEAFKAGYKNIAELSKERIRRAAKKIKEENPLFSGDLGFKVFKLDTSNIKTWEAGFDTLKDDLIAAADYIKQDRSSDDIVFELLLKYGLDLTVPIETRMIAGKKVYSIGMGALVVCLDNDVPMETVGGIGALKEELKPEIMRVVFKDSGFKDDVVKTNALQTLKRFGIEDIKSL